MITQLIEFDVKKDSHVKITAKEGDINSRNLEFRLLDNSLPFSLVGRTVRCYMVKPDKRIVFSELQITDAEDGRCVLTLSLQSLIVSGMAKLELIIYEAGKKLSVIPIKMDIIKSLNSDKLLESTNEFGALNDALWKIDTFKASIDSKASKEDLKKLSSQLDTIVQSPNLVDKLEKLIQVRGMYARVASDNSIRVGVGMNNSLKSIIEYRFVYNADGLLLLRGVLSGVENPNANKVNITLNGTFNTNTSGQAYTTTVGDKFTFEFTGQSLFFKRYCEARGGVWKITLNNGMERKVTCYSETGGYKEELIFDNLEYATYKGVAEFLGADSFDSDTSIVRGYLFYGVDSSIVLPLRVGKILPINESTAKYIVSENSVPDYAIQGRKSGTTTSFAWSPVHGATTGVSNSISTKVYFNGVSEITSPNGVPGFSYKEIDSFSISQKFDVYNPNAVSDGILWKHNINHIIDIRNPYLTIQNAMNLMQDVNFGLGYFGMLPSKQSTMNKLMLNNGVEYSTLPTVAQEDYYDCKVTSGVFIGELISGNYHACAIDMSSVIDNYNIGKDFEPTQKARISFRTDDIAKIYFTALRGVDIPKATKLSCQNRICCVSGIQYPNDSLGI